MKKFFLLGLMTLGVASFASANDLKDVNSTKVNTEALVSYEYEDFGYWEIRRTYRNGNLVRTVRIWHAQ